MYNQITSNKRKTAFLIFVFSLLIIGLGWAFSYTTEGGPGILVIAVIFSVVMSLTGYYAGDKIALATSGARPISKTDSPYIYRLVENLCITAGIPTPKIYIIEDQALNAFATGRDPKHASIALTTGIVNALENEELEGVIAHELSHVKNYDIRVMTIVIVLVGIVVLLGDWFLRARLFGFGGNRRENNQAGAIMLVVGLLFAILAPLFAQLIKLAISRKREYLADASGSLLTRYPEGLARALEKIAASPHTLRRASNATAHLFISNPFRAGGKKFFSNLFSTHPPIEDRIAELRKMA